MLITKDDCFVKWKLYPDKFIWCQAILERTKMALSGISHIFVIINKWILFEYIIDNPHPIWKKKKKENCMLFIVTIFFLKFTWCKFKELEVCYNEHKSRKWMWLQWAKKICFSSFLTCICSSSFTVLHLFMHSSIHPSICPFLDTFKCSE